MKVLKNNYKEFQDCVEKLQKTIIKPYPRKLVCENCQSELEYEESDLRMGALGCMYLDCPCCGRDNMLEENENTITLTANNVEFPTHFFHTSKENGAVDVSDDEIKKFIQQAIDYFRKHKDKYAWQTECGNLYMGVYRYDGDEDYEIIVSKDYYSTYIPFESEDC